MFFCLQGEHFDGNTFLREALDKGASFVITDNPDYRIDERCILVDDTLTTLQELAHYHRTQLFIPVIGITGTNGKTTTKELLYSVLSTKYKVYATKGNLNNHIGVPLTLLAIDATDAQMAIVEMGANHSGEIADLCRIALPTHGVITNIGKAHLEGFGSIEEIIQAKLALYRSVQKQEGILFVNADDTLLMRLSVGMNRITYGKAGDYQGICMDDDLWMKFSLPEYHIEIQTQLTGGYNFYNAMTALAIGFYFDVPVEQIQAALASYSPSNSRSQVITKGKRNIIIDAYNANPASMEVAIANLAKLRISSKAVLLGDMYELGEDSQQEHQYIVDLLRKHGFAPVYLMGTEFLKTDADASWLYTRYEDLEKSLQKTLPEEITILVKGSHAMRMERFLTVI
jgi:UDP-N-acetylmuramoyl-tripeptide--D-alanyl-D-alanine ligase